MSKAIIIEIRAGAGGEEAALFAADLFRMYSRFAEKQGWTTTLIDSNQTGLNGYKEVIFEIKGKDAYEELKYEGGVHRVQRIPTTEKSGRVHTSTISVAVLPEASETEIKINPQDLRIDVLRASGPGGQHVNKRESAVRITHLPTGLAVSCQEERTQQQNREKAMKVLRARLLAKKRARELAQRGDERREQIGSADRSEKIRTYNYPQNRITDHRIKKSWHNLDRIIDGDLKPIIKAFKKIQKKKQTLF
jgi:peptide chain release factor 1